MSGYDPAVYTFPATSDDQPLEELIETEARGVSPGGWQQIEQAREAYNAGREGEVLPMLHEATTRYLQAWCKLLHLPFRGGLASVFYQLIDIANDGGPPDEDDAQVEATLWLLDPVGMALIHAEKGWHRDVFTRCELQDREREREQSDDKPPRTLRIKRSS